MALKLIFRILLAVTLLTTVACSFTKDEVESEVPDLSTFNKEVVGQVRYNAINGADIRSIEQDLLEIAKNEYLNDKVLTLDFNAIENFEISFPEVLSVSEENLKAWAVTKSSRVELPRPKMFINHEDEEFFSIEDLHGSLKGSSEANIIFTDPGSATKKVTIRIRDIPRNIEMSSSAISSAFSGDEKLIQLFSVIEESGNYWSLLGVKEVVNTENSQIIINVINQKLPVEVKLVDQVVEPVTHSYCAVATRASEKLHPFLDTKLRFARLDNSTFSDFNNKVHQDSYTDVINPGERVYYGIYSKISQAEMFRVSSSSQSYTLSAPANCRRWSTCMFEFADTIDYRDLAVGTLSRSVSFDVGKLKVHYFYADDSISRSFSTISRLEPGGFLVMNRNFASTRRDVVPHLNNHKRGRGPGCGGDWR